MKVKIVDEQFLVNIQYGEEYGYNPKNVLYRRYFTDFANGGRDFVVITKLVDHKQIEDYK